MKTITPFLINFFWLLCLVSGAVAGNAGLTNIGYFGLWLHAITGLLVSILYWGHIADIALRCSLQSPAGKIWRGFIGIIFALIAGYYGWYALAAALILSTSFFAYFRAEIDKHIRSKAPA